MSSEYYEDYEIIDLLVGLNSGGINAYDIIGSPRLSALYQLNPEPVELALSFRDSNLVKLCRKYAKDNRKPFKSSFNFYIVNSGYESEYSPILKKEFMEKKNYIFDIVGIANSYDEFLSANIVKFFTYSEVHRDIANDSLKRNGIDIRLDDESFDEELGRKVYLCSKLISPNDIRRVELSLYRDKLNELKEFMSKNDIIDSALLEDSKESVPATFVRRSERKGTN